MPNNRIVLGSKSAWLFGRIGSWLIIIPPFISASSGLLPKPDLVVVLVFWIFILFLMRGWSYGYAEPDGVTFVSWVNKKHLSWTEIAGVSSSGMGIRIQRRVRGAIPSSLLFNPWNIPLSLRFMKKHHETVETLQRWWLNHRSNNLNTEPL